MLHTLCLWAMLPVAMDYAVQVEVARALTTLTPTCACAPCHCNDCSCAGGLCSCTGCGLVSNEKADSYAQAYSAALKQSKPLVVWVGGNFCERCVADSQDEFIHHFAAEGWNGNKGPATVIYVPHQGDLYHAGTAINRTVGSHDWGHVPSARRIVAEYHARVSQTTAPLKLLNNGSGTRGMSDEMFRHNYRGTPVVRSQTSAAFQAPRGQSC